MYFVAGKICNYHNYALANTLETMHMNKPARIREVKLIPIGNSRGIRLPKALLDKYGWSDRLTLEEREESVVLRGKKTHKLSWEDTSRAMAAEEEDWGDFDVAIADGVD